MLLLRVLLVRVRHPPGRLGGRLQLVESVRGLDELSVDGVDIRWLLDLVLWSELQPHPC